MLFIVGLIIWGLIALFIYETKTQLPYGGAGKAAADAEKEEGAAEEPKAKEEDKAKGEDVPALPKMPTARWAPVEYPSESDASDAEEEDGSGSSSSSSEEEGEETEEMEEGEEGEEEETEEEWEDESEEEGADGEGSPKKKKKAPPKERETCKMQFIILNTAPRNIKLQPGALCDIIANLSIQNIIKVRALGEGIGEEEGAAALAALKADPIRAEWLRAYRVWDARGVTKITLRCDTREAFDAVVAKAATELNMPVTAKVIGPQTAVACIGPVTSDALKDVTGHLKLLS